MGKRMKYYFSVAAAFMRLSAQSSLEYPINLLGWVLANPIQFIVGFATIKFVVDQFGTLAGWGYQELSFLYGLSVLSHGLAVMFFIQTWYMGKFIIRGEFDQFLLRPMNVLFQFLFMDFNLIGISDLIPGLIVFIYGCYNVHFQCDLKNILLLAGTVAGGTLIRGAVWIICGSLSFWTKSTTRYVDFTRELFDRVTMYPLTIYPRPIQWLFTFLLPLGWITFYPAGSLLGKQVGNIPVNMALVTLGIGVLVFGLGCIIFTAGTRRYESAGS